MPGCRPSSPLSFVHDARASLILQTVTLPADLNHGRMSQQAIHHGGCQHNFTRKDLVPASESEVRGEDHGAKLIALAHHLKNRLDYSRPISR